MSSIGAYTMLSMRGEIPRPGYIDSEVTAPGVYGVAYMRSGWRGEPGYVQTIAGVSSTSAADTLASNYAALQGTLVSVTPEAGAARSNIRVVRVMVQGVKRVQNCTSGSAYLVSALWVLEDCSIPS